VLGTFAAIGGAWMLPITLQQIAKAHLAHPEASILGTNGARDGSDVVRFLLAGARAVAMTSAVITDGPAALRHALNELDDYCTAHGVAARDLVGEAARHVQTYEEVAIERRL
jgi:dihydroorotate dehydrogenase